LPIGPRTAGHVHEDVDPPIGRIGSPGGFFALLRIGEIARHDNRFGSQRPRLCGNRIDRCGVAADKRELRPLGSERLGDGRSHALGRPRDHRNPPGEFEVHGRFRIDSIVLFFMPPAHRPRDARGGCPTDA